MTARKSLAPLFLILVLYGCTVGGQVLSGRRALLVNDYEQALAYFLRAAESNPNYIYRSALFQEGIWTYVGRAQYNLGKLMEARQSFERALSIYQDDYLARIYLGLTLLRSSDENSGLKEIERGLKELHGWIEYMIYSRPHEAFWDPNGEIRAEIENVLTTISGKDIDRQKLISSVEWIGFKMEDEIDRVRQDERRMYDRDRGFPRSGLSIGVGVGF